ncbi:hypothetical protein UFOVP257_231 [uncultured Caudovirales phage]|uniref:Uncharacterized protein n=1 Tax=uncultured Caudovirales phage TaxID=2100421 RepID=A0A6J5LP64_9CAUD|nr:hypothetical protein UFOVP257_231 [uncultured Caudovirales phage]
MTFKLRRFSDEKQDQIEQLIAYATMLGLSGTDLVAIGRKIEREKHKLVSSTNLEIIKNIKVFKIENGIDIERQFKIKTANGSFNFENNGWNHWTVTSLSTNIKIGYKPAETEFPKSSWQRIHFQCMLYDIATGAINLNF